MTLTVPNYEAYCVIQVIDMQNYSIATIYAGETKTITLKDVSLGKHVYLNARTQPTSYDEKGIENAHKQQRKLIIKANSSLPYKAPENLISDKKMLEVRTALIKDVAKGVIKDYSTLMGTKDAVNEKGHLYATAYGWGGLPIFDAGYLVIPNKASGKYCSSVTLDVPTLNKKNNGFWSITTYNKQGWLARDKAAISDKTATLNNDGTVTIWFNCEGKPNNINTTEEFAVLFRTYAPISVSDTKKYLKNGKEKYVVKQSFDVNNPEEWPVKFSDYGFTPDSYAQAESYTFMSNFIKRASVNQFFHFKNLTKKEDHWVVSPNNDVLYSVATIDATDDFTLVVPEVKGKRLLSVQIIDGNHFTPKQFYGAGEYHFSKGTFKTDMVALGIRVEVDVTDPKDIEYVANEVQPNMKIIAKSAVNHLPKIDNEAKMKLRKALLPHYEKLYNSFGGMVKNASEVKDQWLRMICTAGAWGLSEDEHAMYLIYAPGLKADKAYKATYKVPIQDAFWSMTMYDTDKFLVSNDKRVINKYNVNLNEDGTFTVCFGSKEQCGDTPNRLDIVDGWNFLLRAYKPNVEAFKKYHLPEIKLVESK